MLRPISTLLTLVSSIVYVLVGPALGEPRTPAVPTTTAPPASATPAPPPADPCASEWCWREVSTEETGAVVEIDGEARSLFMVFGGEVICARPAAADEIPASLAAVLRGVGEVWLGSGGQGPQYFFRADANPVPGGPVPGIPCPMPGG